MRRLFNWLFEKPRNLKIHLALRPLKTFLDTAHPWKYFKTVDLHNGINIIVPNRQSDIFNLFDWYCDEESHDNCFDGILTVVIEEGTLVATAVVGTNTSYLLELEYSTDKQFREALLDLIKILKGKKSPGVVLRR